MIAARSLRDLFEGDPMARLVVPGAPEEDFLGIVEQTKAEDAQTVGGEPFVAHPVPPAGVTGFTHFLDGAQRSWRCLYYGLYPTRLAHTSAAIVERVDRRMERLDEASYRAGLEAIVPDLGDCPRRLAELLGPSAVLPLPVGEEDTDASFADKLARAVSDRREGREIEASAHFREGWLLVDGGVGHVCRKGDPRNVVGVVKTHGKQYFRSPERTQVVLNLREGERTTVFHRRADGRQGEEAYAFYLRLREAPNQGPLYGIARIELPPRRDMLDRVDEICGWLMHERAPLSLPDPRHDRLLYPVRLVEGHLKARQPSEPAIRAIIGL